MLLAPLGPKFKDSLHLSPFASALVVAVPVIVASLGRIPVRQLLAQAVTNLARARRDTHKTRKAAHVTTIPAWPPRAR